jgi:hypothetical protein
VIHSGRQTLTLSLRAIPVDWGNDGHFALRVGIATSIDPLPRSTSMAVLELPVTS